MTESTTIEPALIRKGDRVRVYYAEGDPAGGKVSLVEYEAAYNEDKGPFLSSSKDTYELLHRPEAEPPEAFVCIWGSWQEPAAVTRCQWGEDRWDAWSLVSSKAVTGEKLGKFGAFYDEAVVVPKRAWDSLVEACSEGSRSSWKVAQRAFKLVGDTRHVCGGGLQ